MTRNGDTSSCRRQLEEQILIAPSDGNSRCLEFKRKRRRRKRLELRVEQDKNLQLNPFLFFYPINASSVKDQPLLFYPNKLVETNIMQESSSKSWPKIFTWQRRRRRRKKLDSLENRMASTSTIRQNVTQNRIFYQILVFLSLILVQSDRSNLASAQEIENPILPAPEPLLYALEPLAHEYGSGDHNQYNKRPTQSIFSSSDQNSQDESISSPSLIEAKCWNNLADDNDCRHLNVITGPVGDNQASGERQGLSDSLITPIVILESSSTVPNEPVTHDTGVKRRLHLAPPYYQQTSTSAPKSPSDNDIQDNDLLLRPSTATVLPPTTNQRAQPTRPSMIHYVATTRRPKAEVASTTSRKCHDENDADCDEPEGASDKDDDDDDGEDGGGGGSDEREDKNDILQTGAGWSTRGKQKKFRPDTMRTTAPSLAASSDTDRIEFGSGNGDKGAPTDDTEDSTDDDVDDDNDDDDREGGANSGGDNNGVASEEDEDEGDDNEVSGEHSGDSSLAPPPKGLLDISNGDDVSSRGSDQRLSATATTTVAAATATAANILEPTPTATIDIVVHPSLPSNFPTQSTTTSEPPTTSTTPLPDETVTSKPIFPPSIAPPAESPQQTDIGLDANGEPETTTAAEDLHTFRPVPLPSEAPQWRGGQAQLQMGETSTINNILPLRQRPVGPLWTTHWPQPASNQEQSTEESAATSEPPRYHRPGSAGAAAIARVGGPMGTDMLPTLLLYASVIILATTTVIFVVMALIFWRRNNERRRILLQKLQQANGPMHPSMGGGGGRIVESMSQASHLHQHQQQPPQPPAPQSGLVNTYASMGKSSNGTGKITTNLVRGQSQHDDERLTMLNDDEDNQDEDSRLLDGDQNALGKIEEVSSLVAPDENQARNIGGQARDYHGRDRQQQQQQQQSTVRSWGSGEDQSSSATTSATTSSSASSQPQTAQLALRHHKEASQQRQNYPNSLSDGRQNSSSISDSQCSPDSGQHHQPPGSMHPSQAQTFASPMQAATYHQPAQLGPMMSAPRPSMAGYLGGGPQAPPFGIRPQVQQQQQHVIMMQNGSATPPTPMQVKNQFVTHSRSIETLDRLQADPIDGGFLDHERIRQQVPSGPNGHLPPGQQHHHLITRPGLPGSQWQQPSMAFNVSPQRVAMNPLATLGRRFPPGTGLNRNLYSEDSSSFMTTSPSLARTSSSSSFAFNSIASTVNLASGRIRAGPPPPPPPIKPKPFIDASGRILNDYSSFTADIPNDSNGTSNTADHQPPPVYGRRDRSEAWFL